jgi:hypothetical protein
MPAAAPPRRRRGRRIAAGLSAAIVLAAAVLAVVFSRGEFQSYPRTELISRAQQHRAPAWTRPCWAVARWSGFSTCLHVSGRVVWRQAHDPDGDGDRHLFVVSRMRVHLVKLPRVLPLPLPPLGADVDAAGWMTTGSHGRTELEVVQMTWSGRSAPRPSSG